MALYAGVEVLAALQREKRGPGLPAADGEDAGRPGYIGLPAARALRPALGAGLGQGEEAADGVPADRSFPA